MQRDGLRYHPEQRKTPQTEKKKGKTMIDPITITLEHRDITLISMCLHTYINMQDCPESEDLKAKIRAIIRVLDNSQIPETAD